VFERFALTRADKSFSDTRREWLPVVFPDGAQAELELLRASTIRRGNSISKTEWDRIVDDQETLPHMTEWVEANDRFRTNDRPR
jgi:hypothetical protein